MYERRGRGVYIWVVGCLDYILAEDWAPLDPTLPAARRTAEWFETTAGVDRRRTLALIGDLRTIALAERAAGGGRRA